jgi:hypothetical protein
MVVTPSAPEPRVRHFEDLKFGSCNYFATPSLDGFALWRRRDGRKNAKFLQWCPMIKAAREAVKKDHQKFFSALDPQKFLSVLDGW